MKRTFFERETSLVAKELIGKLFIVRDSKRRHTWTTRIVETEAYRTDDRASHCSRGWTPRCAPMFEHPGRAYVYFVYGMHTMINFVAEPKDTPGAVLIRALEPVSGFPKNVDPKLLNGPGKLCRELGIALADNRASLLRGRFEVRDDGIRPEKIWITPRVGIREDEPYRPWRFLWADHPAISRAPQNKIILATLTDFRAR